MKKVFFAAFAGVCVLTSIMATPAAKTSSNRPVSQILRDTVPPKDTTKMLALNAVVLRDTILPKKDTTKLAERYAVVLMDTVPPKDTTKVHQLVALAF